MRTTLLVLLLAAAAPAASQEWEPTSGTTSADMARMGVQHDGSAGLSWPDGRQAVVTFWSREAGGSRRDTWRCVTRFDADLRETSDLCSKPSEPRPDAVDAAADTAVDALEAEAEN